MNAATLRFFSLRTKLLVFAAALIVLPGALAAVLAVAGSRTALTQAVGRQLVGEARNAADRLATVLRAERARLESFAAQDLMREMRIGDLDKRISSFLVSARRGCPACGDLVAVNGEGGVVAASNPTLLGTAVPSRSEPGTPPAAIAGPVAASGTPEAVLEMRVPIPDPDAPRATLGSLVARYDWTRATAAVARVRESMASVGLDADVLVLDERDVVIGGATRPGAPWQPGDVVRAGAPEPSDMVPAAAPEPPGDVERAGADGGTAHVDAAAGMLVGRAPLPRPDPGAGDAPDELPPWSVIVAQPLRDAYAPAYRTGRLLALALAVTLVGALALALIAAGRVTRPIAQLTAAAEAVGAGAGPAPQVAVRSRDEIGVLAEAFNRMGVELRRAERELVDAAKFAYVGELAAGVAHEVRTPLGVLRSSAQLLERSLPAAGAEVRELLQIVRDEVDRIERVVSELLALARPRELRLEAVALGPVVFRTADFVEAQAREKRVAVRRSAVTPEPVARCDPDLVHQVALNLLVNAVQVVPPGGTVEVALLPSADGWVGFEVRDDGPGMADEVRERLFEPFFSRREGGTGLGLTFVQRVVHAHHGRLAVRTASGAGTTFRVELPAAEHAS